MYEVGLSREFTAWHVMPGLPGPEGELHTHDYRFDVIISRDELDERGMVCDIDVLDAALDAIVAVVEGKNVDVIEADAAAVTVEVLAHWAHGELTARLPVDGHLTVRAWESPVAFGGYAAPITSS